MNAEKGFTHVDAQGQVKMVDVGGKQPTQRTAKAQAIVHLPQNVVDELTQRDFHVAKGSVIQTAVLAGIMAAKKTGDLIPLCHPLGLDAVDVQIQLQGNQLVITGKAALFAKTGVEMEALTAVSVAALTVYDMCKALSHDIVIGEIKLMEKTGGKHDFKR